MTYKVKDIVYETKTHFAIRVDKSTTAKTGIKVTGGYEVYKIGITHATRCAIIGWNGDLGLARAIAECERRSLLIKTNI